MSEDRSYDEGRYVGRQVRLIRARRGISQQVLAERVGVSRGAIAKYENGERPVDSRRSLLEVPPKWWAGGLCAVRQPRGVTSRNCRGFASR
ncbi:helix-turn-helix domain-containing protein, partial [Nocardia sp. NPDC004711]